MGQGKPKLWKPGDPQDPPQAPAFLQRTALKGRVMGATFYSGPPGMPGAGDGETLMCVHCQMHWTIQPGSGMTRGFCMNCNGPTCGKKKCDACVPWEKAVEIREGRDPTKTQF